MKNPRSSKRQLEQLRQEKAARKRQRRIDRASGEPSDTEATGDQQSTLDELAQLHELFAAGSIGFDDFETAKQELIERLHVD